VAVTDAMAWALATSDAQYYIDMRKSLGMVDANGNGLLVAALDEARKESLRNYFTTTYGYDDPGRLSWSHYQGAYMMYEYDKSNNRTLVRDRISISLSQPWARAEALMALSSSSTPSSNRTPRTFRRGRERCMS
jgi:hypothetical protein